MLFENRGLAQRVRGCKCLCSSGQGLPFSGIDSRGRSMELTPEKEREREIHDPTVVTNQTCNRFRP